MISGGSSPGFGTGGRPGPGSVRGRDRHGRSGRVPAALNGLVGFKPSRGLISTVGLVPAWNSLDCISVMAGCIGDVDRVFEVMGWPRLRRRRSRTAVRDMAGDPIRVGLPPVSDLEFFGDDAVRRRTSTSANTWAGTSRWSRCPWSRSWPQAPCWIRGPGSPSAWSSSASSWSPVRIRIDPVVLGDLPQWPDLHGGRRVRRAATASGTQSVTCRGVADHRRPGGPDHRDHLHRRPGPRTPHRDEHHARALHPLRAPARSARIAVPPAPPPTAGRTAPCCWPTPGSDDTALALAAQIPRRTPRFPSTTQPPSPLLTVKEQV